MVKKSNGKSNKRVTRYTFNDVKEPRTPETGHTAMLPADEQVVTVPMDNGWSKAMKVGKLPDGDERPVVVDMDPAADPTLFWAGKRNRRQVAILPLQRNEIVSESRIAQITDRARKAATGKDNQMSFGTVFADLEKSVREGDKSRRVEFYKHDENWKNKLICGDSLHLMESLIHYEGMKGRVQMIFFDPPYGISYNSNFQQRVDSTKNDENDKADDVLSIKAFRDTWTLGIHSYLSYIEERLYLCRELLADSGSIFMQIGEQNLHIVRTLMSEVFGEHNFCSIITYKTSIGLGSSLLDGVSNYLVWFAKDKQNVKYQELYQALVRGEEGATRYNYIESPDGKTRRLLTEEEQDDPNIIPEGWRFFTDQGLTSRSGSETTTLPFEFQGETFRPTAGGWRTSINGLKKLAMKGRILKAGKTLRFKKFFDDFPYLAINNFWTDVSGGVASRSDPKVYAVQTSTKVVERCILMTTRPGEIVFDPTCGSGTTAVSAEKHGRRWVTCDASRVSINVARQRLLSLTYDHFVTRNGKLSDGMVYKTVSKVSLETLANDLEPAKVELLDQPAIDKLAVRVTGPFEVMTLGRYSVEDWKGAVVTSAGDGIEQAKLENYIEVICRLYRKNAAMQGATGLVHAIAETEKNQIAISVGPISGRVTCKQINDAVQDALASGILEVHVLGWAYESNVGETKATLERRGKVKIVLQMIRPDTLAEGLKVTQPETLFSPLALPEVEVKPVENGKEKLVTVVLNGVAIFDRARQSTDWKQADSGYISAWYLDEDYDGDCFVDCQMFFDFKKAPNLKAQLGLEVEPEEYKLALESQPFPVRSYKRIAVKVVDVYGNESTVVREII